MNKSQFFIILGIIAILCASITLLFYSFYSIKEIKTIPMDLKVEDYVGINTDSDALHFGAISPGGVGTRAVVISNNYKEPLRVKVELYGDFISWVSVERDFVLEKGEAKKVAFTVSVPSDAVYGNYTGKAVFVLKKH